MGGQKGRHGGIRVVQVKGGGNSARRVVRGTSRGGGSRGGRVSKMVPPPPPNTAKLLLSLYGKAPRQSNSLPRVLHWPS